MNRTYELIKKAGFSITAHFDGIKQTGCKYIMICNCDPWDCGGIRQHVKAGTITEAAFFHRRFADKYVRDNFFMKCEPNSALDKLMREAIDNTPLLKANVEAAELAETISKTDTQQSTDKRGRL